MTQSLFSAEWNRVARLQPRLRPQVRIQRLHRRGEHWYVLSDASTGRQHIVNESAYQFIGRCDGHHDVQRVWDAVLENQGDTAPTQEEIVQLLARLNEHELLQCDHATDTEGLFQRSEERSREKRRRLVNPFAFRFPLGDPSGWLPRLDSLAAFLFRPVMFWLWLALVALGALLAAANWGELQAQARASLAAPGNLAIAWLVFPLVKSVHELGHALAVRRWGGEVHEVGITLLVLVPAPYVDASASAGFAQRSRRAAVAGAGVMVETTLAVAALLVCLNVQPGLVRDVTFVVMAIGGISTLVFNGNPLLRFDAYFVLCDLLDLPNLAARSAGHWSHLVYRHLLRVPTEAPQAARGETPWLLLYAPLSFAYRLGVSVAIILWFGSKWFLLGLFAAVYVAVSMLLRPLTLWCKGALAAAAPGRELRRTRFGIALLAAVPGLLLFVVPAPLTTVAPAVVWLPENAHVRPEVDGFIAELPRRDGDMVQPGDLLVVLENPDLKAARDQLLSRLDGLQAELYQLLLRDPVGARNLMEQVDRTEAELRRSEQRIGQLEIRAQVAGRLVMPRQADMPGRFGHQGEDLGYVLNPATLRLRAAVPEMDAHLVRNRTRGVEARLADAPETPLPARLVQDEPAASYLLPSAALGERGHGPYPTDPADPQGRRSLTPVFLVDVTLPGVTLARVGSRSWVRFDHGSEPLAFQALRRTSQLFLKHFDPTE
ncbi:MAG TPA: efflux RND transporter periplasmic adaptor subunit [Rhodocyclaceae bacterium]|nr:efflux RND transporter periplasmic adaptor subunit [Rhodocyclaceae bacterium]